MQSFSRDGYASGLVAGTYTIGLCLAQTRGASGGTWSNGGTDQYDNAFTGVSKIVVMITN
jgi:hypothetical protein